MSTGIEITVTRGSEVELLKTNTGYTVSEESTPIDPADTTGAAGTISVGLFYSERIRPSRVKRFNRATLNMVDIGLGTTSGIVRVPSGQDKSTTLTADLLTALLSVDRQAQPYNGFVTGYVEYLLGLVGITSDYVIDTSFNTVPAVFPGWNGEVWLKLKELAASVKAEVTYASNNIVFRPVRGRVASPRRETQVSWAMDDTQLAQRVEGYWYSTAYKTAGLAFPPGGWNSDVRVESVGAGETVEFEVPLESSLSSVLQPVVQDYVAREYEGPLSVYCVMGNDGLPVTAAQWAAMGGSLTVEIGEDTRSLVFTLRGANIPEFSPFSIAATAGPSNKYSSLRIVGTGVFMGRNNVVRYTGLGSDITTREIGATLDSPFITSLSQLLDCLAWTRSRYSGARHTLSVRTMGIHRDGDDGSYRYPKIEAANAFSATQGWATIANLNSAAPGLGWGTIEEFNEWWAATVADDFENQAFGNVAGARVFRDGLWFRIRTASIEPGYVAYSAENDTTATDFNAWATEQGWSTIADFNASEWAGKTFEDFNVAPLEIPE